ncbi:hypothetical protein N4G58_03670 [Edwardsiella piscicida]|nr:hypothetical protein N4G58_03670 [Edwardsiella piscicida]
MLQHSEAAQNLLASGMSVEAIRRALAEDASTKAFLMSGVATGLFGGQGDTVLAKIMTGQLKQGIVKRIAKGAVAEGILEEMPQSALSQMAENYALQTADPQRPLSEAVMNQALGGVAIGGVMGGRWRERVARGGGRRQATRHRLKTRHSLKMITRRPTLPQRRQKRRRRRRISAIKPSLRRWIAMRSCSITSMPICPRRRMRQRKTGGP